MAIRIRLKSLALCLLDALLIGGALLSAFTIRFLDDGIPVRYWDVYFRHAPAVVLFMLTAMYVFGINRTIWRYASTRSVVSIVQAVTAATVALAVWDRIQTGRVLPRSVLALNWLTLIFFIGGARLAWRMLVEHGSLRKPRRRSRVLIAGAGDAGEMLAREINRKPGEAKPIGFVDDDPLKQGKAVDRVRVLGTTFDIPRILKEKKVDEVIIAAPSAPARLVRDIVRCCQDARVKCRTLPDLAHFVTGSAALVQVRDVALEDLLGRDPVAIDLKGCADFVGGKTVLVTGAGGSIGSELCRQIAPFHPLRIVLLDHCENRLRLVKTELAAKHPAVDLRAIVGDIKDQAGMTRLFVRERPDVVFHAAAHKHVDFLEESPREAILNNVVGTQNVAEAAERAGVRKFVFISTDKAVNPASVMGASKRVGEMLVQCLSRHGKTDFVSVRFGNVLGSDGSVVPIFRRQIELGGPVTVTHPQARRYFMTVSEAARLVIQAGALGRGGQVYVLDMGEQVRVLDVARQLIRLSGLDPGKGIEVRYTGLRPGEKLEEELLTNEEKSRVTEHHRIFAWDAGLADECDLRAEVERIRDAAIEGEPEAIRAILMRIVPEYRPRQVPPALTGLEEMEPAPVPAQDDIRARVLDEGVLPPWKRAMDLAIGSVCLAAAVPLMIGVVAAKLLSGATPLFVVEQRVGANKRGFGRRRLAVSTPIDRRRRDRRSRALPGRLIRCPRFATSAACRHHGAAARVDRFIRNYRLDKLPYLLTVLKGDLSLVGPKPEKLSFAVGMPWEEGAYPDRLLVAPGITGLAQVRGCPDHDAAGFARRLEYDLFYVSHRSLGLDLSTLARTIPVLLSGRRRRHAHRRRTAESGLSDAAATRAAGLRK